MRNIKRIVRNLIKKHGTHDPLELARSLNVRIYYHPLSKNINALYMNFLRWRVIILNQKLDEQMQRIFVAHELGHHILHRGLNYLFITSFTYMNSNKYEIEADRFAAELLIPDECFYKNKETQMTIEQIAAAENIPSYFVDLKNT